jgi:hypothetical protein
MDKRLIRALYRIKNSSDGPELMEYLANLSKENYKIFKYCDPTLRDIYAGRAQAFDEIKDFLQNVDILSIESAKLDPSDWSL